LYAAIPNRGLLSDFCKQHLGELCFARDTSTLEMKSTLNHYFNHFGHQQQTADAMGIHRNTLRYRLNRIEQRLGYSLQDSFLRLNLQNALLIEQILFHHHDIEEQADSLISPND
jgi:DNA-binding PucR family transcriptional regulator